MTLAEAAANIGARVRFEPVGRYRREWGVIRSVSPSLVFVLYEGGFNPVATMAEDLSFDPPLGPWGCLNCGWLNRGSATACSACMVPRYPQEVSYGVASGGGGGSGGTVSIVMQGTIVGNTGELVSVGGDPDGVVAEARARVEEATFYTRYTRRCDFCGQDAAPGSNVCAEHMPLMFKLGDNPVPPVVRCVRCGQRESRMGQVCDWCERDREVQRLQQQLARVQDRLPPSERQAEVTLPVPGRRKVIT